MNANTVRFIKKWAAQTRFTKLLEALPQVIQYGESAVQWVCEVNPVDKKEWGRGWPPTVLCSRLVNEFRKAGWATETDGFLIGTLVSSRRHRAIPHGPEMIRHLIGQAMVYGILTLPEPTYREVAKEYRDKLPAIEPEYLTSTVLALAKGIDEDLDFSRAPILADALQDAGLDNDEIFRKLREGEGFDPWMVVKKILE
jgi:hypothetical protein